MTMDALTPSKSLHGITEITLMAPIKRGLIPALDARSYESRTRLTLRALNGLRVSTAEVTRSPVKDVIDGIRGIHTFRLGIAGTRDAPQVLLFVSFDGGWEPYMRQIWRDLGPFLDLVFCNCEGYLTSNDHPFAAYIDWVRRSQVATDFFYHAAPVTVGDLHYLREAERSRLGGSPVGDPPFTNNDAMPALVALYRLGEMYPPLGPGNGGDLASGVDGGVLWRAAHQLLHQVEIAKPPTAAAARSPVGKAAWAWFTGAEPGAPLLPVGSGQTERLLRLTQVQGGILQAYAGATHGCLVLLQLPDAAAALALCLHLKGLLPSAVSQADRGRTVWHNLAFTWAGLQSSAVPDALLRLMPQEFKEGMAARNSVLGDVMVNHPLNWPLPAAGWPDRDPAQRVAMASVHAVVQIVCRADPAKDWVDAAFTQGHALYRQVEALQRAVQSDGVRILAVQSMQRLGAATLPGPAGTAGLAVSRGHFGYVDGISQPALGDPDVKPGDLLLGFENSLGDPPLRGALWDHSTFLVVRKLRQDVAALRVLEASVTPVGPAGGNLGRGAIGNDLTRAAQVALMGRDTEGHHPFGTVPDNNIDYTQDRDGERCPFHAHIRRANPRQVHAVAGPVPRILRRGMSYGPLPTGEEASLKMDRGLVFMAYNASIAEQFEVIQGWLAGGNSGGQAAYSGQRDPFVGLRQAEDPQHLAFVHPAPGGGGSTASTTYRMELPSKPLVTLEWGLYLFVPSLVAVDELITHAGAARADLEDRRGDAALQADNHRERELLVQAQLGAMVMAQLKQAEQVLGPAAAVAQWKTAVEDVSARMSGVSANIWAAVRKLNGGVQRSAYGVLVASRERVMEVLGNDRRYSATGYATRMAQSFGEIYLGRDNGADYRRESGSSNAAITRITREHAYAASFQATEAALKALAQNLPTVELRDLVDLTLADLCRQWFGLPDGQYVEAGGWHWRADTQAPTCPGHFHAPSRYMFQPHPGEAAERIGQAHGQQLRQHVRSWVAANRKNPPGQLLAAPLFAQYPDDTDDAHDAIARNLIGLMMGFLPTVDGNLRGALYEWVSDSSLWTLQLALREHTAAAGPVSANLAQASSALLKPLIRTLQLRPVPEVVWRTAMEDHVLGGVKVEAGDRMAVSLVSALQETRLKVPVDADLSVLFGGDRRASGGHPTHACPGKEMAMGVMLGFFAALLQCADLKPTLSPMALEVTLVTAAAAAAPARATPPADPTQA